MTSRLEIPRSRGAASGTLLLIAGLFGAAIPFVGPLFDWEVGPGGAFDMTTGHFWLSLVPGLAVVAGALILAGTANRLSGGFGAWLALAGGAWFVVGPTLSRLFDPAGWATGGSVLEHLTYYEGLGALIVALSALALGRMTVAPAAAPVVAEDAHPVDDPVVARAASGRFTRDHDRERARVVL
jgi:hypothetical protein